MKLQLIMRIVLVLSCSVYLLPLGAVENKNQLQDQGKDAEKIKAGADAFKLHATHFHQKSNQLIKRAKKLSAQAQMLHSSIGKTQIPGGVTKTVLPGSAAKTNLPAGTVKMTVPGAATTLQAPIDAEMEKARQLEIKTNRLNSHLDLYRRHIAAYNQHLQEYIKELDASCSACSEYRANRAEYLRHLEQYHTMSNMTFAPLPPLPHSCPPMMNIEKTMPDVARRMMEDRQRVATQEKQLLAQENNLRKEAQSQFALESKLLQKAKMTEISEHHQGLIDAEYNRLKLEYRLIQNEQKGLGAAKPD